MIQSIVTYSQIEDRLDAEYYKPEYLSFYNSLRATKTEPIISFAIFNKRGVQPIYVAKSRYRALTSQYIKPEGIDYDSLPFVSETIVKANREIILQNEDIVIYTTGAYVGNSQIWLSKEIEAIASNHVNILRVQGINPYYLTAVFISVVVQKQIQRMVSGAAQAELYPRDIERILIPIVSYKEQEKIGKLIQEAHQKRQLAKKKYEEARRLVNEFLGIKEEDFTFEQSFSLPFSKIEDRLDGEYYQPRYLKAITAIKSGGYKTISLGSIASKIRYGTSQKVAYQDDGVPFLRVTDIDNFFSIDPQEGKFISEAEAKTLQSYAVQENDLLISRTGTLGSVVHINKALAGSVFGSYFIKVTPKKNVEILPLFAAIFLNSLVGKLQSERYGSGGIQTNLTIEMIKELIVPAFKKRQQEQICRIYSEALQAKKESKNLLEQAKQEVEKIITSA